jgi:hypothetical protein
VPDLDHYRGQLRGFYYDLAERAPGPLLGTQDELVAALEDAGHRERYAERYAAWQRQFNTLDDGRAAQRVVDRILRRRGLQGRSIAEEPLRSPHSRLLQNLLLSLEDLLRSGIGASSSTCAAGDRGTSWSSQMAESGPPGTSRAEGPSCWAGRTSWSSSSRSTCEPMGPRVWCEAPQGLPNSCGPSSPSDHPRAPRPAEGRHTHAGQHEPSHGTGAHRGSVGPIHPEHPVPQRASSLADSPRP